MEQISAKSILGKTKNSSWFGTDYNMNLYRGCCHGCIYCDSRSSCYQIEAFDRVRIKQDALLILEKELHSKRRRGVIGTGSMSDPYNLFERREEATRGALALIDKYRFGVSIATKGSMIKRDIDLLQNINAHSPVICKITVTTCDDSLGSVIEPHAPSSSERLEAVRELTDAGIFAGILLMPVLPFITDREEDLRLLVEAAREAGAKFIYPGFGMTLRDNQRDYYYAKLEEHFSGLKEKYQSRYGERYSCGIPAARKKYELFSALCRDYGILYRMEDIIRAYKPSLTDYQLSLFR